MGIGTGTYAITYFVPTILNEFKWTAQSAQLHTIPVYVVAGAGMLSAAWASDRTRHRYGFFMLGSGVAAIGFIMMLCQDSLSRDAKYTAVFLIALGGYTSTPICLAWLANNMSGQWKRSFGAGLQVTLGNVAGIIASNIFVATESPTYKSGHSTSLAMVGVGVVAATALEFLMWRENKQRDAGELDSRLQRPREEVENMGDYHPSFRFTL
jgi:predicted MFS family arabinose efflux permease